MTSASRIELTVIIPCRNERACIAQTLDSILASEFPKDRLEVLVIDGESDDGTRDIVERYSREYEYIRLVHNPDRQIPHALNRGIEGARGELILRLDAHSALGPRYLALATEHLRKSGADRVGGRVVTVPRDATVMGRAIAKALSSRFGVGGSRFRTAGADEGPTWVDTVPFWCCRKDLFDKVGLFDVRLERSEDIEHSLRARRMGVRTLLVPDLVCVYFARSRLKEFWVHAVSNGRWAVLPWMYVREMPVAVRHLIPLAFVATLLVTGMLSLLSPVFLLPLGAAAGAYALCNLGTSAAMAIAGRDPRMFVALPVAFAVLHLGYGWGSLRGVAELLQRTLFSRPAQPGTA